MNKTKLQRVSGRKYLNLALFAFAGLGIEVIYAYFLEPILYGIAMAEWTVTESIIHWCITCITWGIVAYALIQSAKNKYGFDLFMIKMPKMKIWQWICTLLCLGLMFYISYSDWQGFKPFIEFKRLGIPKFIFQYIYYACETLLFMLILIFGQKACEVWFKKEGFPYGGIIVAATWGLAHIFTKGSLMTGILSVLAGFSFGIVYLLLNRDIKKVYPVLLIMFII